ncbi:hypothetical protein PG999_003178 [Apiospora kogelbergensis]|uniref:PD-(D/E)XK nuclease-like domain-containing protein n=1 Tax=Apiospora kogelbergensis TaxID=1337665 RepID=A0AAW0RAL8_9PEZI
METPHLVRPGPMNMEVARHLLPQDIHTLFQRFQDATHNIKTVPAEVSDEVKRFGVKLPLEAVREPAPANPPFTNVVPKPFEQDDTALAARDVLQDLCTILQDTRESVALKRHEDVWNHLTHGLILRLGFRSHAAFLHSWHHDPSKPRYSVRCESVMNATIDGGCITKMKGSGPPGPACHMETIVASDGTVLQVCAAESLLTPEHSTSSHNKVDFILALNMAEETPLRRTVDELDKHPLKDFIAVPIKTLTPFQPKDPLEQLGIWAAAWHKRMYQLRHRLQTEGADRGDPNTHQPRLVSMPLIQVIGHEWSAYFACDQGPSSQSV